jgi:hypothetical protein
VSWSVWLEVNTGYGWRSIDDDSRGCTWNVCPMFYAAGLEDGVRSLDGKTASEVATILAPVVQFMEAHPTEMRALNPKNGWGSYESALNFLRGIMVDCQMNPACRLVVT